MADRREPTIAFRWSIHRVFMWYLGIVMATRCPTCDEQGWFCSGQVEGFHAARSLQAASKVLAWFKATLP